MSGDTDGAIDVFRYVVAEKAGLYRRILDVFLRARERYRIQLRPGEVGEELGPFEGEEEVTAALDQLSTWGNLGRSQDTEEVSTLADFYRRRSLYQLTREGEAAHQAVRRVTRLFAESAGRLSSVKLPAIREHLEAILELAGGDRADAQKLHGLFSQLYGHAEDLAENARRFMRELSVSLETVAATEESFLLYKRAVLAYLQSFVSELGRAQPEIARRIRSIAALGVERLIALAASADMAPRADGVDIGPVVEFREHWLGLEGWFIGAAGRKAEAEHLRDAAGAAISKILAVVDRLNERRYRRVNRAADFLRLAAWFAGAASDRDAHELFDRAFGLFSARHFTIPVEDEEADRGKSFGSAAPAPVAPRLRKSGRRETPGRFGAVPDYSAAKREALRAVRQRSDRIRLAAGKFLDREVRLSDLGRLGPDEFAFLLEAMDAALRGRPDADGVRRGITADGRFRVGLFGGAGVLCAVETEAGVMTSENFLLSLTAGNGGGRR